MCMCVCVCVSKYAVYFNCAKRVSEIEKKRESEREREREREGGRESAYFNWAK